MYTKILNNYKCSVCSSIIEPEFVRRGNKSFKRCIVCGHESVYSTIIKTENKDKFYLLKSDNINIY